MDADVLIARLALSRGWITREVYARAVAVARAPGLGPPIEDALLAAGLTSGQITTLRGALRSAAPSPPGGAKDEAWVGDWRLLRRVGIGGMGSVFEARHRRTGRRAAVKVLLPRLGRDPDFTGRFMREARVLARISHPNVVHAYDAGKEGEFHFIAMELVEGEDLRRILERDGCLSPVRSAEMALAVARALEAIHRAGLVHRDVKPANILIAASGAVKLADLGLFRDGLDRTPEWDGLIFGTPQYMSPEQVLGSDEVDIRSDLYSLGASWYHALIGRPPFAAESPIEVAKAQVEEAVVPPRDIRPDVPLSIDRLVLALLEKDPARRPPGPEACAQAIEAALSGLSARAARGPRAPPPSWLRRRALPATGLLLAALLFLAGLRWWMASGGGVPPPRPAVPPAQLATVPEEPGPDAEEILRAWEAARDAAASALEELGAELALAVPDLSSWRSSGPAEGPAPARADSLVAPVVHAWAEQRAVATLARLDQVLGGLPEGLEIAVLLRDGSPAALKVAPRMEPRLASLDGRAVPLSVLHAAAVIAWAELDPDDPLPDGGVGLAIALGALPLAVLAADAARPELPPEVRVLLELERAAGGGADGIAAEFLLRARDQASLERAARGALRAGRWDEAQASLSRLLDAEEPSPIAPPRRDQWEAWRARAGRLAFNTARLFAVRARAVDPLQGEAIRLEYGFEAPEETRDFRFDGRAWSVGESVLSRERTPRSAKPGRGADGRRPRLEEPLDGIALFSPPLRVEGRWSARGKPPGPGRSPRWIAVGFAGRFVALGGEAGPVAWRGGIEDGALPSGRGPEGPRPEGEEFRVEFTAEAAAVELAGGRRMELDFPPDPRPGAPAPGRVAIALEPGAALEMLRITGTLDPLWAEERRRAIEGGER